MRRPLATAVAQVMEAAMGRRNLVRVSRFLLDHARLDAPNRMASNGELMIQRTAVGLAGDRPLVVLDVGANAGEWSAALIGVCAAAGSAPLDLHAFEPSAFPHAQLSRLLRDTARSGDRCFARQQGMSDEPGEGALHKVAEGAGSNSLHPLDSLADVAAVEPIELTTIDRYCEAAGIAHVALLKTDAEGHDLAALRGAARLLRERRVDAVQFEYNVRWAAARCFLRDAFALLIPWGYRVGKVTPRGVEFYDGWDWELETFREANFVAVRAELAGQFPSVAWWKG